MNSSAFEIIKGANRFMPSADELVSLMFLWYPSQSVALECCLYRDIQLYIKYRNKNVITVIAM